MVMLLVCTVLYCDQATVCYIVPALLCFALLCLELKELDNVLGFVDLVTSMKLEKYIMLNRQGSMYMYIVLCR